MGKSNKWLREVDFDFDWWHLFIMSNTIPVDILSIFLRRPWWYKNDGDDDDDSSRVD